MTLSLILTLGVCAMTIAYVREVEDAYHRERAYDVAYQQFSRLRAEMFRLYVENLMLIDRVAKAEEKPKRFY